MWKCHKCGKPVYFAERKQSLGYDWHPECLRCEECGKRLNPGQHAEHKGVPYCHVPCYGALFGPQLFGHGTRVESHTSFGRVENRSGGPNMPRSHLESKLKIFNQFYDGRSGEIRSREVNGRLVLEGALRIHWGVLGMIHLKEDDDQRTVVTVRKRNSCRSGFFNGLDLEVMDGVCSAGTPDTGIDTGNSGSVSPSRSSLPSPSSEDCCGGSKSLTLPPKLDVKQIDWDELDDLLQVERKVEDGDKLYQTLPVGLMSVSSQSTVDDCPARTPSAQSSFDASDGGYQECMRKGSLDSNLGGGARGCAEDDGYGSPEHHLNRSLSGPGCLEMHRDLDDVYSSLDELSADEAERIAGVAAEEGVVVRRAAKTGSAAIRRRPGARRRSRAKLRRRCSINGHFYDRETSFFTPPHGSQMSVWVTSLVSTPEVINLLLEKYKVDSKPSNFALFVVRDNGEQRRLRDDEYPLLVRVMLGPHEDVAKLFLMDRRSTEEISSEVAQFLNLSLPECRAILDRYNDEEEREIYQVLTKFREMRKRIKQRMEELKERMKELNQTPGSAVYGLGKFSDMSQSEFQVRHVQPRLHHHVRQRLQRRHNHSHHDHHTHHGHHTHVHRRTVSDDLPISVHEMSGSVGILANVRWLCSRMFDQNCTTCVTASNCYKVFLDLFNLSTFLIPPLNRYMKSTLSISQDAGHHQQNDDDSDHNIETIDDHSI